MERLVLLAVILASAKSTLGHGEPETKFQGYFNAKILPNNKDKLVVENANSLLKSSNEFPCPETLDILPCNCSTDSYGDLNLDCSYVSSEEELKHVFQQQFPVKEFNKFRIYNNYDIQNFGDIINGLTFETAEIEYTSLWWVSEYAFFGSRDTLQSLSINHADLRAETFPFLSLDHYSVLETLELAYNNFTSIPEIYSTTLESVNFSGSPISNLTTAESFSNMNVWKTLTLNECELTTLQEDTFLLRDVSGLNISLSSNSIETILPGAFTLDSSSHYYLTLYLNLSNNNLTSLDEEVFVDFIGYITYFIVKGNPLECNCNIAWIVNSSTYMSKLDAEATCDDGTLVHSLDPIDYQHC